MDDYLDVNSLKDEEILERSLESPKLFELLVDKYQPVFLRTAMRVLNNKEHAEDACQEAFVKIYFNAKKFHKRPGVEFKSWAFKILMNCTLNHYRRIKRRAGQVEYDDRLLYLIEGVENSGESALEKLETKNLIESVLQKMPGDLSELLREHYLKDKPYEAITREKGITTSALKMKLFRARKSFKNILKKMDS
jgi:RNA polymerase sigma-70 factor (ECF subfamily)